MPTLNVGKVDPKKAAKDARKALKKENMKKYEEYFLRYQLPARLAAATNVASTKAADAASAASLDDGSGDGYTAEVPALDTKMEAGVVPTGKFGVAGAGAGAGGEYSAEVAMDAYDAAEAAALANTGGGGGDSSAVATAVALDVENFTDSSAKDMMEQLKREADAYVNPQTGKAMRWGDTWWGCTRLV